MVNKILLTTVAADLLFLAAGAAMLGFCLIVRNVMDETPAEGRQAARNLLYQKFPLEAGIVNAIFIFITFVVTLPGLLTPARSWLKLSGILVTICGIFTMCMGVFLWVLTLRAGDDFFTIWMAQEPGVQDLMQTSFNCCGYFNSTSPAFVTNPTCPSPAAAALMRGCAPALTSFANIFIDDIFTALFGVVGIDVVVVMAIACLLKDRKERERYRHIDEKSGYRGI
ncbi:probable Pls1 tetraspanin [Cephalotrichum gorgonifer]|uniref:Probable Pls1 tetraspanin n=1 Tax=Cephalotrichum gorgonifer TaxID=2041049 RepID=A0AAE8MTT2_9PEZI|nr:probable Pls1 tetraspanin [Cephalotrichum gorgonifer]